MLKINAFMGAKNVTFEIAEIDVGTWRKMLTFKHIDNLYG
jgi:hypothetical protein